MFTHEHTHTHTRSLTLMKPERYFCTWASSKLILLLSLRMYLYLQKTKNPWYRGVRVREEKLNLCEYHIIYTGIMYELELFPLLFF